MTTLAASAVHLTAAQRRAYTHDPGLLTLLTDPRVWPLGKQVATHSRSGNSVKISIRSGVDCVYHCELADEEALDMMDAAKDRIFLGPAVGLLHNTCYEAEPWGITKEVAESLNMPRNLQKTAEKGS